MVDAGSWRKALIIQTAFLGDVILATSLLETLHAGYPTLQLDILVREGNQSLFEGHPYINKVLVWNKKSGKYRNLNGIKKQIRRAKYDAIVNVGRFGATAILTHLSGAKVRVGFKSSPLSFLYSHKVPHRVGKVGDLAYVHEIERNYELIKPFISTPVQAPKLYPSAQNFESAKVYGSSLFQYVTISPASVWATKAYPTERWIELCEALPSHLEICLLGGMGDREVIEKIRSGLPFRKVFNLGGKLSYLGSAALMAGAIMNFTNDSGPLHMASAMGAPLRSVFCSTIPEFGFGPLGTNVAVVQKTEPLYCRPCGLHGHKKCPEGHFRCALEVDTQDFLKDWSTNSVLAPTPIAL